MNNTNNNQFIIPFVGLKVGKHDFEFEITDAFFEDSEYSLIQKGKVLVKLNFEKKETMMIGNYNIGGMVVVSCNRCNDELKVDIDGDYRLVYKFDSAPSNDESLVIVYPEEFELNIRGSLMELINVSLPVRAVHTKDECNNDMLDLLDEYVVNTDDDFESEFDDEPILDDQNDTTDEINTDDLEEEGNISNVIDPRWEALKKLKK